MEDIDYSEVGNGYIQLAESLFGAMSSDWEYDGVFFDTRSSPFVAYYADIGKVKIALPEGIQNNLLALVSSLAHEACHLLYPTKGLDLAGDSATVFNEGTSTYFSIYVVRELNLDVEMLCEHLRVNQQNYYQAYQLVKDLLDADIDSVKKLRGQQPMLNKLKISDFKEAGVIITNEIAKELLSRFE